MLAYLLKSSACMVILLLFYKLLLERENMHVFKRFYLLGALVASLIIPNLVFLEYIEPMVTSHAVTPLPAEVTPNAQTLSPRDMDTINFPLMLWSWYLLGLFGFGIRFLSNLGQIIKRVKNNPKLKTNFTTKVLLQEKIAPHTFLHYIFLNQYKFESNAVPKEVLLHEETHARQHHSFDMLFIEILKVVLWFNPFLYFYRKAIKLNHEFLADRAVLKRGVTTANYQNTLLSYLSPDSPKNYQPMLANAINYSSIKKRFTVMKTQTSKKSILIRSTLVFPLLALTLYGFSERKLIQKTGADQVQEKVSLNMIAEYNALAKKYYELPINDMHISRKDIERLNYIYNIMSAKQRADAEPFPFPDFAKPASALTKVILDKEKNIQNGASRELMAEYDKLAKYYNKMPRNRMQIKGKDVERLEYIYSLMSEKQKNDAEPFPDFPPMPEPPLPPSAPEIIEAEEVMKKQQMEMQKQHAQMEKEALKMEKQSLVMEKQQVELQKQHAKMEKEAMEMEILKTPPPPPPPKSPLEFAKEMVRKNAIFYYNGEKISSDKAIELLKNSDHINLNAKHTGLKQPVIELSNGPIRIVED
ncbi:MAG: M56 family metallopeptidase [Saonia sp.]